MEYDLDHRDSLHQVFDHLELPPWLTGTSKRILPEDLPNMSLNTMDALVSDNANSLKAADPAEDAEGMAGCATWAAQQTPKQCSGPAGVQSVGHAGGGQHNSSSSPNLPAMPSEAPPDLPTSPQPAPALLQELPSVRAVPVQALGTPTTGGVHGAAHSTSKVKDGAGAPATDREMPTACPAPVLRPALTECMLVSFDWMGQRQSLHVLRERGAACLTGAFMILELRRLPLPKPPPRAKAKLERSAWDILGRALELISGGAASWLSSSAERQLLAQHGAFPRGLGGRPVRMILVTVALEELERVCGGHTGDVASLKAALTAEQPVSPAGPMQGPEHPAELQPPVDTSPLAPVHPVAAIGWKASSESCSDAPPTVIEDGSDRQSKLPKEVRDLLAALPPVQECQGMRKRPCHAVSACQTGSPVSVPIGQQDPQTPCTMPQHHLHPKMPQHTPKRAVEQGTARRKPGRPRRHEAAPAQRPNGAYTEAQYRAHMNERKDSMARLGSVFIQESMAFAAEKDARIQTQQREIATLREECIALQKLCAELKAACEEAPAGPSDASSVPHKSRIASVSRTI